MFEISGQFLVEQNQVHLEVQEIEKFFIFTSLGAGCGFGGLRSVVNAIGSSGGGDNGGLGPHFLICLPKPPLLSPPGPSSLSSLPSLKFINTSNLALIIASSPSPNNYLTCTSVKVLALTWLNKFPTTGF